ncbi:MAG: PASTA domain-containing protein [Paludibacter sp.]|jgi:beta-lactam-binding protein with PASTA domain|nr:PASTA domain-containing protein [Paludibacter sp.]
MDFKSLWNESIVGFILKRVLLAAGLVLVLTWGTLLVLDEYTRLGEAVPVPDLRGLYEEEAASLLRSQDLYIQVIDSVHEKNKALGTIIEQIPAPGSSVKKNRSIFLILNKRQSKTIPMPEVNDISYRQADALLRSLGLKVGYVQYRPSEFKDLVIDVHYNGQHIEPGTRLPEGSSVVLVVGSGFGEASATVPFLLGTSLASARSGAVASSFIVGSVNYDEPPLGDEELYRVYRQEPSAGEQMAEGTRINIWLTKDSYLIEEALKQGSKQSGEEEEAFF